MDKFEIQAPDRFKFAEIDLPSSKSISNRLLILNALSYSPYPVKNLSDSDDTKALIDVLTSNSNSFDVGAGGTTMRFLTAYLSKIVGEWYITGSERMKQRPVNVLIDALNSLGAKIEYVEKEGYPPLKIFGSALKGGEIEMKGDVSSQYISALLMIAPYMEDGLTLHLKGEITSRPYIDLTLKLMEQFGIKCSWKGGSIFVPAGGYIPVSSKVEGDWSAASYWYQAVSFATPGDSVVLKGLKRHSWQGDSVVREIYNSFGVTTEFSKRGLKIVNSGNRVKKFSYNFINEPDLAQTVAVTAAFLGIPFNFKGLHTLTIKETNRIEALITELQKFGFIVKSNGVDNLYWEGERCEPIEDITVSTYKDHRMAMSFGMASLITKKLKLEDPSVVNKSYRQYWDDLLKIGFTIDTIK
ncbi:3-phosphoshikimate 1-carboxyvinyltransferase [Marinilabiliaceae bacterium ANBcel2]|nr:3-phosphoshikimate 1-carboxyvinyltransferase [Marinilabiliaceae bacterium ANBcel2]